MSLLSRLNNTTLFSSINELSIVVKRWKAQAIKPQKLKSKRTEDRWFVDFRKLRVYGGDGGDGALSFLNLCHNEFAGPDGGNGGNGGHIVLQVDPNTRSLRHVMPHVRGHKGVRGQGKSCHGKNAEHIYIKVPKGTTVKDEHGTLLYDLTKESDIFVAARGGAGGRGNEAFLSNENREPKTFELGGKGEERLLHLELSVIAHFGLVGFPNAGKSTLLRAISRAKPKVAAYPFTTLNPHVGMIMFDDLEQIAVADIPGLVKGAHLNYGLGFSFLRHIERCSGLLFVIDLAQDEPWTQLEHLKYELDQYSKGLSERPCAILANKIDLDIAKENLPKFKEKVDGLTVIPISAREHMYIDELLMHLRLMYDEHVKTESVKDG